MTEPSEGWCDQQKAALAAIQKWLIRRDKQVFNLSGYAGTGKTTLATEIAAYVGDGVLYAAFTGKAASVMRAKGCTGAQTLHSLIYRAFEVQDPAEPGEPPPKPRVVFALDKASLLGSANLLIIDESSMVGTGLGRDVLSFGCPTLVLGDPAQLPPVKAAGYFCGEPDVMLTEIHRQARDNPIIKLSMIAREGGRIDFGDYGACRVISIDNLKRNTAIYADQVLVGTNRTRRITNRVIRKSLGFTDPLPCAGDKLVCLRNDKEKGLLNGTLWIVQSQGVMSRGALCLEVKPLDDPNASSTNIIVRPEAFTHPETEEEPAEGFDAFTYGYALTVHKSQGSQWDNVVMINESAAFRGMAKRWLYTGVTRAAKRLTIAQ